MKPSLICSNCGHENDIGRVLCRMCGGHLDLKCLKRRRSKPGLGGVILSGFKRVVIPALLAVFIFVLSAMLWPVEPEGSVGSMDDAELMYEKILNLEQYIRRGDSIRISVREEVMNAYLYEIIRRMSAVVEDDPFRMSTRTVNLSFTSGHVIINIITKWGPVRLSYEITGIPGVDGTGAELDIQKITLGHVWMPEFTFGLLVEKLSNIFSKMKREQYILRNLSEVEVEDSVLYISVE